ncbi:MAG: hypothetical protein LBJ01_08125 [Tannerella sp.]|jgi:hypothetical protein|nr:hypothetical protein [Tannerella sp.]
MKKYYDVDYSRLMLLLTPVILRNDLMAVLLEALALPLDSLNGDFVAYTQSLLTRANAQTCYMRAMLNDEFDYYERRITVRTAVIDTDSLLLWRESKNRPAMIFREGTEGFTPRLLSRDGLAGANSIDFEIVFPRGYTLSVPELRRLRTLVNRNKPASKKYRIVYG